MTQTNQQLPCSANFTVSENYRFEEIFIATYVNNFTQNYK